MDRVRLNTQKILSVEYDPSTKILHASLQSGLLETYGPIAETRYWELVTRDTPSDIDTFFLNLIKPHLISTRSTAKLKATRATKIIAVTIGIVAAFIVFDFFALSLGDLANSFHFHSSSAG